MLSPRLPLEGAFNVRDLAEIPTANPRVVAGRVYRADALHRFTEADCGVFRSLGVSRVFDLRSEVELANDGVGDFVDDTIEHRHVPLVEVTLSPFDPTIDWSQLDLSNRYVEMLAGGGAVIAEILTSLAAADAEPTVFHCTGGKDRTGVVAAVLLRALGVDDATIVDDYATSEHYLAPVIDAYRDTLAEHGLDEESVAYLTLSPPKRMRHTLAELDRRWGGTDAYLDSIGIDGSVVDGLRRRLLDVG